MPGIITIQSLQVWTRIGVPHEERAQPQKLEISASFPVTTVSQAAHADDISLTVNYYDVSEAIKAVAGEKERNLIETLAEDIAARLLIQFDLKEIELEVRKFIIPDCRYVSLKIKRDQH